MRRIEQKNKIRVKSAESVGADKLASTRERKISKNEKFRVKFVDLEEN
jgi:hypothetical protein